MSVHPDSVVLVGAGQASAVAARTLRRRGYSGRVVGVGDEPVPPYQRPPLSKEYLADADDTGLYLLDDTWCADKDVELMLGRRATQIRPDRGVELDDGTTLAADAVLLAPGGRPRRLPGAQGERIHYLRTVADADALRARLTPGSSLVVVGAGFIGLEVAATARARGVDVTVVDVVVTPLERVLGRQVGAACAELHRRNGVGLVLGRPVTGVVESGNAVRVEVEGGRIVEADVAVIGIGIEPNVDIAERSNIAVGNGILVDPQCRTSMPGVFAAGDVANHEHPLFGGRIRAEHFDNANKQGAAAANAILGREVSYRDPHWFWSDQYDANLQYTGHAPLTADVVLRGEVDELDFAAFYLVDGRLRAAFGFDRGGEVLTAREIIANGGEVDIELLRDDDADLAELTSLELQ